VYKHKRKIKAHIAIFGVIMKNAVTAVGAPSYTSGVHMWNGTALILNKNATNMNNNPIYNGAYVNIVAASIALSVVPCTRASPISIPSGAQKIPFDIANNFANSSKFVNPVNPYSSDSPKSNDPDDNAPNIKYFNPASVENSLFL